MFLKYFSFYKRTDQMLSLIKPINEVVIYSPNDDEHVIVYTGTLTI